MELLFICSRVPSALDVHTQRVYFALKYMRSLFNHRITLVAVSRGSNPTALQNIGRFCDAIELVQSPNYRTPLSPLAVANTVLNTIAPENLLSGSPSLFNYEYEIRMHRKIRMLLEKRSYDLIYADDYSMIFHVLESAVPKTVETWPQSDSEAQFLRSERALTAKLFHLFQYYKLKSIERKLLRFDMCIACTTEDERILKSHLPNLNVSVVPYGIDSTFFRPMYVKEDFPSIVIAGNMSIPSTNNGVISFCKQVYPQIQKTVPNVTLKIVGRNPPKEILALDSDKSITVTGFVRDIRPFLASASVAVSPSNLGSGVKTSVMQAMSMGRPLVATSMCLRGLNVIPGEDIVIANGPRELAQRVIDLLNDERLRKKLGSNARRTMQTNHSWEKMTAILNGVFEKVSSRATSSIW